MTPQEVEVRLAAHPGQATVRALIAAMDGDDEWSAVSAAAGGRIVWAEFTHLPSGTVLTLAPEELQDHQDQDQGDTAPPSGSPQQSPGDGAD